MIALDAYLDTVFESLEIKRYPVQIMNDGVLYVPETLFDVNCINETFYSVEYLSGGAMRVKSQFYFFSALKKKDNDTLEDVNVKMLNLIIAIGRFRKTLNTSPYRIEFQTGELNTFRALTNAWEAGLQCFITFDIEQPC